MYQTERITTYQNDSLRNKQKLIFKVEFSVSTTLSCHRMRRSNTQASVSDGVDTEVLLSDIAYKLRRKNVDVTDIYFILLDAAKITPILVLNQNAKAKGKGSRVFSNF